MDLLIPRGAGGVDQRRALPLAQAAATLLAPRLLDGALTAAGGQSHLLREKVHPEPQCGRARSTRWTPSRGTPTLP